MLDTARVAALIDEVKRSAEAARAHLSWWSLECAGMREHADHIANALYAVAAGIECDVRKEISKDLVDAQAIRSVAIERSSCGATADCLELRLNLGDIACFAVPVAGKSAMDRSVELGQIAESIDNCASSARFVLSADTGRSRWPAELAATARLIRHLASAAHRDAQEG